MSKSHEVLHIREFVIESGMILALLAGVGFFSASSLATEAIPAQRKELVSPIVAKLATPVPKPTTVTKIAPLSQNLLPARDNVYTLGSAKLRWKSLQLGPGTLYIQDQITGEQAGLTVRDGSLLIDGAASLGIGNIQLTSTGLRSLKSDANITIGDVNLPIGVLATGRIQLTRSLEFPDGTIQSTAMLTGLVGRTGPQGLTGSAGARGLDGVPGSPGAQGAAGSVGPAGPIGLTGPQGLQGIQGVIGETGPQGLRGIDGVDGSPGIQGATGPQGVDGPQGVSGADGVNGSNGADGAQGVAGSDGLTGPQGLQGPQGIEGPQGAQGNPGIQGTQGIQGIQGAPGAALEVQGSYATMQLFTAAALVGSAGQAWIISATGDLMIWNVNTNAWQSVGQLQGPQGIQGNQGIQGITGAQGIQGIQGETGPAGPQGLTGLTGDQGIQGIQGNNGADGATGATGPAGADGATGLQGPTGLQGATGDQGPTGLTGLTGLTGDVGATGATGSPGATGATVVLGYGSAFSRTATNYFTFGPAKATEAGALTTFPAGSATRLSISLGAAPGAGSTSTFTVMNAGVATTLACSITGTETTCTNNVASSTFALNATFSIRVTQVSNPTAAVGASWSVRITP
jgi:hypothetical protein